MNCYYHPNQPAVAQCPDCGKGLCVECAAAYSIPLCKSCSRKRINTEKGKIIEELLLTFGIGILLAVLFVGWLDKGHTYPLIHNILSYTAAIWFFSGIVSGWKALNRITPSWFLILPIIGWVIYFAVKLCLSACVGLVMLPIRTVRNVSRLKNTIE